MIRNEILLGLGLVLLVFTIVPKEVYSDHDDYNDWYDARNFYNLQDQIRDFYDDGDYDVDWDDRYYYRDYDCDDDDDCDWDCDDDDDHHDCDDWDDCDDDDRDCDYHDNDDYDYHDDDKYEHDEDYRYEKKYESDVKIKDNNNREQKIEYKIENFYDYSDGKKGKLMKDSEIIMKGDNTNKNEDDD